MLFGTWRTWCTWHKNPKLSWNMCNAAGNVTIGKCLLWVVSFLPVGTNHNKLQETWVISVRQILFLVVLICGGLHWSCLCCILTEQTSWSGNHLFYDSPKNLVRKKKITRICHQHWLYWSNSVDVVLYCVFVVRVILLRTSPAGIESQWKVCFITMWNTAR